MKEHTLYLVRHGATAANHERRYVGWQDPPLSQEGLIQAQRIATRLISLPVSLLVTSDLGRARQTAEAIARATGLTPQPDPRLREVHFGQFEGLTYEEILARWPAPLQAWLADPEHAAPPGGESLQSLRNRVLQALPTRGQAALVTHGGVIRAVLAHFTGRPFWDFQPPPGSLTILRTDGRQALEPPVTTPF